MTAFTELLSKKKRLVLDGGFATEMQRRGYPMHPLFWSGALVWEAPRAVERLHFDYLVAGADIIMTASYQLSFLGFEKAGIDSLTGERFLRTSAELALKARERFLSTRADSFMPLVAASIGPYGAFLADGSEYHGNYDSDDHRLALFHERRITVLASSGVDILACETIPGRREAEILVDLVEKSGKTCWISFQCRSDQELADGSLLRDAAKSICNRPAVEAVGINCVAPDHVSGLLSTLKSACNKPLIVYPNLGRQYDASTKQFSASGREVKEPLLTAWFGEGADVVGGCCEIGVKEIRDFADGSTKK